MQGKRRIRMTPQRRAIMEVVAGSRSHPTADEVYESVRQRLPKISLGTVYRNLEVLSEGGVIRKLEVARGRMHFDGNAGEHHHVRCVRCGRVDDVELPCEPPLDVRVVGISDYKITGCDVVFTGICPDCLKRNQGPIRSGKAVIQE